MPGQIGNKGGGRKPKSVEINIIRYYEDLLPKVFIEVRKMIETGNKKEKLWAMEWIKTGLVKMIPQINKISGNADDQTPIPIYNAKSIK
jgi:hypothetical protein